MINAIICAVLILVVIGWLLHVNARDRKTFEKELDQEKESGKAARDDPDI